MKFNLKKIFSIMVVLLLMTLNVNMLSAHADDSINDIKVNNKVLIVLPDLTGDDKFLYVHQNYCRDYLKKTLEAKGYDVEVRTGKDADIFTNMNNYGFIFIYTHGIQMCDTNGQVIGIGLYTGKTITNYNELSDNEKEYYKEGTIGITKTGDICVKGNFISKYNNINNSVVYLGACDSTKFKDNTGLIYNFKKAGASFVIGFDTTANYSTNDAYGFTMNLSKGDLLATTQDFAENFILKNKTIKESIIPMTNEIKDSEGINPYTYKMSYETNDTYNEDSKLDVYFPSDGISTIEPSQTLELSNNTNDKLLLSFNFNSNEDKPLVDYVTYMSNGSIYYMSHNVSTDTPIYLYPGGKTKITNIGNTNLKVLSRHIANLLDPTESVVSLGVDYKKLDEPTLKIVTLKPNETYSVLNMTNNTSKIGFSGSCKKTFYFNYNEGSKGFGYPSSVSTSEVQTNERIDVLNNSTKDLEIYLDNSFENALD